MLDLFGKKVKKDVEYRTDSIKETEKKRQQELEAEKKRQQEAESKKIQEQQHFVTPKILSTST